MRQTNRISYRLLRLPPIDVTLFGEPWQIVVFEVHQGGGTWRCSAIGRSEWSIAHTAGREQLLTNLTERGVEITRASFVGTVFRELERLGVAERAE